MDSQVTFTLGKEYGYVLLTVLASNLQCAITGVIAGGQRKKYKVPYPDMGNGRHAAKLSDKEWEEFNNYQRTHYNYLEHLTPLTANLLIGGLFNPILTTTLGVVYMVGRFFYTRGYIAKGAKGRMVGAIIQDVGLLGMVLYNFYACLKFSFY